MLTLWASAFDSQSPGQVIDPEAVEDARFGGSQLGFNSHESSFVQACVLFLLSTLFV